MADTLKYKLAIFSEHQVPDGITDITEKIAHGFPMSFKVPSAIFFDKTADTSAQVDNDEEREILTKAWIEFMHEQAPDTRYEIWAQKQCNEITFSWTSVIDPFLKLEELKAKLKKIDKLDKGVSTKLTTNKLVIRLEGAHQNDSLARRKLITFLNPLRKQVNGYKREEQINPDPPFLLYGTQHRLEKELYQAVVDIPPTLKRKI